MGKKIHAKTSNSLQYGKKRIYFWKGSSALLCRLLPHKILTPFKKINC